VALPLSYNWRNVFVRRLSSLLTFVVVAVVVFVLAVLLSFAAGMNASLAASGSKNNILVLAAGATAESMSLIFPDQAGRLVQAPGIQRDKSGELMVSQETCVQTSIPRRDAEGGMANVAVRGIDAIAYAVHSEVRLVEGRLFEHGSLEAIVGKAAQSRYRQLNIGDDIQLGRLGNRRFTVVGVFEANGAAIESEIWTSRTILADAYLRPMISSALIRIDSHDAAQPAIAYINGPAVGLDAKRETDYYRELSSKTREIVLLATILVGIMGIGAVFAVANTMYAAVDGRRREIAMLRTLGFGRSAIMLAFAVESLIICIAASLSGLACAFLLNGYKQDYLSDATWTVLAFEMTLTPGILAAALITAMLVGVLGATAPAVRAARVRIIDALRKA